MSDRYHERRRYFRVMDRVGVRITVLTDAELLDGVSIDPAPEPRIQKVESAIRRHLAALKKKDESLATLIGLINHKIDLLFDEENPDHTESDAKAQSTFRICEASISACGIAFPYHKELPEDQKASLRIKLLPSHEIVQPFAAVVACDRRYAFTSDLSEEEKAELRAFPYWLRVNFEEISVVEQELLAQHVIQRQATELAARRNAEA